MIYTQTVEIPADHRLTIDVPREIPAGTTARFDVVWYIPGEDAPTERPQKSAEEIAREMWDSLPTREGCLEDACKKTEARLRTGIDPLEEWRDSLNVKKIFGGVDGVAYQRSIRDEWPD
jgi:hypothetical protein